MQQYNQGCLIHQQRNIIGICVSKSCKNKRVCCLKCLNEFHKDHTAEVIEQGEARQLIMNNQKILSQTLYQIEELVSIIRVIELSFKSLLQSTSIEYDNIEILIDQIETILKTDNKKIQLCSDIFLITKKQIGQYAECIFKFKMDEFKIIENIEKFDQVKQLVISDGCKKSMKVFENIILSQVQQPLMQLIRIQSLITIIFQFQRESQEEQQITQGMFLFCNDLTCKSIQISLNQQNAKKYINIFCCSIALIIPALVKFGCFKIKFRICRLADWISLGICKKDIGIKNNYKLMNFDKIGHGFYLNSSSSQIFSHIDQSINHKYIQDFKFTTNDIIQMTVDLDTTTLTWINQTENLRYSMKFELDCDLHICTVLQGQFDSIGIIE